MKTRIQENWADPSHYLKGIHVAKDVLSLPYTQKILQNTKLPLTIVPEGELPKVSGKDFAEALKQGKKHLYLCNNKGSFFKPCPGTAEYTCCGYHVLNIGMNCPMDCVYCILQAYLNQPWITAFVNVEQIFAELDSAMDNDEQQFFRIGTGEFTDSLALETITGLSKSLVEYIAYKKNGILELKTKSASIDNLQHADHKGRTILAWSLNSPAIMKSQEIRTATLNQRLEAASRAARWGYKLAFHFDPIVVHDNWREGYKQTIEQLFEMVDTNAIVWISLGALRYLPPLKHIATKRFPHSKIFADEFITGLDGKSRYFRTQRSEMYTYIYSLLASRINEDTCVYFCMESEEIWNEVFGFSPKTKGGLEKMLDRAAIAAIAKY
jgi:spore photoproduct lyase